MALCLYTNVYGLEKATHYQLNQNIALGYYNGCYGLDSYLRNNLGLASGVSTAFSTLPETQKVYAWMAKGGEYEDDPAYLRSLNHFHDPLVSNWQSAGLKGYRSSIVWAEQSNQSLLYGNYSWPDTRNYFYDALTATDLSTSQIKYANCFRGLGQLMHLVQDASVPAHTRNDFHGIYNYEDWVDDIRKNENSHFNSIVNTATLSPSSYLTSRVLYNSSATIPIAGLFDTDLFSGDNPDITPYGSVGLAEYSNANFFSEDTVFNDYKYPAMSSVTQMYLPVYSNNTEIPGTPY